MEELHLILVQCRGPKMTNCELVAEKKVLNNQMKKEMNDE